MFRSRQAELSKDLILQKNWEAIKEFINNNPNANQSKNYDIALLMACKGKVKDVELYRLLLEKSSELSERDKDGNTAFHWAVKNENLDFIKLFIERARRGAKFYNPFLALAMRSEKVSMDIIKTLLQAGANPLGADYASYHGTLSCLHEAYYRDNNGDLFYTFLNHLKNIKAKIPEDLLWNALPEDLPWNSLKVINIDLVKRLLDAGISPNSRGTKFNGTALHFAVRNENVQLLSLLLSYLKEEERAPDMFFKDLRLETPLELAQRKETWACEVVLRGYEPQGYSKLNEEQKQLVSSDLFLLISLHAPIDLIKQYLADGKTLSKRNWLHLALHADYPDLIELIPLLLTKKCNPSQKDKKGFSAILLAAKKTQWESFSALINHTKSCTGYEFYVAVRYNIPAQYIPADAPLSHYIDDDWNFKQHYPLGPEEHYYCTSMQWAARWNRADLVRHKNALITNNFYSVEHRYNTSLLKIAAEYDSWDFFFALCDKIDKKPVMNTILECFGRTVQKYIKGYMHDKEQLDRITQFLKVTDNVFPHFQWWPKYNSWDSNIDIARILPSTFGSCYGEPFLSTLLSHEDWLAAAIPHIPKEADVSSILYRSSQYTDTRIINSLLKAGSRKNKVLWAAEMGKQEYIDLLKPEPSEIPQALVVAAKNRRWTFVKALTRYLVKDSEPSCVLNCEDFATIANLAVDAKQWEYLIELIEIQKNRGIELPIDILNNAFVEANKANVDLWIKEKLHDEGAIIPKPMTGRLLSFMGRKKKDVSSNLSETSETKDETFYPL